MPSGAGAVLTNAYDSNFRCVMRLFYSAIDTEEHLLATETPYILSSDHSILPDVNYESFLYFRDRGAGVGAVSIRPQSGLGFQSKFKLKKSNMVKGTHREKALRVEN